MCCNINDFTPHRAGQHSVFTSAENRCTHVGKNKNRHMIRQFKVMERWSQRGICLRAVIISF